MTVSYSGSRSRYSVDGSRAAEIFIKDESEQLQLDKVCEILTNWGWKIDNGVELYAVVAVENESEFREFVEDYKKAKRLAK